MTNPGSPTQNHLLAALAEPERAHLFPQLELVPNRRGAPLNRLLAAALNIMTRMCAALVRFNMSLRRVLHV